MENKKSISFPIAIIAIIIGSSLYKQFDFETFTFKKIGLSIVYFIAFAFCIYVLLKNYKKSAKK